MNKTLILLALIVFVPYASAVGCVWDEKQGLGVDGDLVSNPGSCSKKTFHATHAKILKAENTTIEDIMKDKLVLRYCGFDDSLAFEMFSSPKKIKIYFAWKKEVKISFPERMDFDKKFYDQERQVYGENETDPIAAAQILRKMLL